MHLPIGAYSCCRFIRASGGGIISGVGIYSPRSCAGSGGLMIGYVAKSSTAREGDMPAAHNPVAPGQWFRYSMPYQFVRLSPSGRAHIYLPLNRNYKPLG